MKYEKRIYCIEGHWDYGKTEVEPSVEPILQVLQNKELWNYARRDCATTKEFEFWLKREWTRCKAGSVLYIASHGSTGCISLADEEDVDVGQLAEWMPEDACKDKWVHFGCCSIFSGKVARKAVRDFMRSTGASCVSGYSRTVGWLDMTNRPSSALELMLFASTANINFEDGRSVKRKMVQIESSFNNNEIFKDCGFKVCTRWD